MIFHNHNFVVIKKRNFAQENRILWNTDITTFTCASTTPTMQ